MVVREGGHCGRANHSVIATPVLAPGGAGTARGDRVAADGGGNGGRGCRRRDRRDVPAVRCVRSRGARGAPRGWCLGLPRGILPVCADGAARCRGDAAWRSGASPRRAPLGNDRDCRERCDRDVSRPHVRRPPVRARRPVISVLSGPCPVGLRRHTGTSLERADVRISAGVETQRGSTPLCGGFHDKTTPSKAAWTVYFALSTAIKCPICRDLTSRPIRGLNTPANRPVGAKYGSPAHHLTLPGCTAWPRWGEDVGNPEPIGAFPGCIGRPLP